MTALSRPPLSPRKMPEPAPPLRRSSRRSGRSGPSDTTESVRRHRRRPQGRPGQLRRSQPQPPGDVKCARSSFIEGITRGRAHAVSKRCQEKLILHVNFTLICPSAILLCRSTGTVLNHRYRENSVKDRRATTRLRQRRIRSRRRRSSPRYRCGGRRPCTSRSPWRHRLFQRPGS
jgi:hypothetical protein